MQAVYHKLKEYIKKGKSINCMVIGAGFMGSSLINQLNILDGFKCNLCYSRNNDKTFNAYLNSGINKDQIKYISEPSEYNSTSNEFYIIKDEPYKFFNEKYIDIIIDATGDPYEGAKIAFNAIKNKKDIVSLNVECDVVIGAILAKFAKDNGVVYTGIAGDEPGTVKELYDFAEMLGLEVLMIGKGKNNPLDYDANFESVSEEANKKGVRPYMLASFVDGSKTMEELTLMCNATGFKPDIPGCHGIKSDISNLENNLKLKKDGGIINSYKTVEYVNGIAPGVFILVKAPNDVLDFELNFLKVGNGPNYILYRPFHLTSIEVPITIAQAHFFNIPTISSLPKRPVADTIAIAKVDLYEGDSLDGPGGKTVYGKIYNYEDARSQDMMPYGLISKDIKVVKNIKKGTPIKYSDVIIKNSTLLELRKEMEDM